MKDYSKLDKQFVMIDMHEDREDGDIIVGVAIPAEFADEFAAEVERLAVEKYGGATFAELLEYDEDDESMGAAIQKNFANQVERVLATAEKIMKSNR